MYKQKEVDAIKALEAKTPVSAEVLKARYEAKKLLCKTCENGICSNGCAK
jgi:tRNA 2-selenouridine synthase SelU